MTNSSSQKLGDLTTALLKKTKTGEISWELTSLSDTYATRLGDYTIHITSVGRSGTPDIVVKLFNNSGNLIDQFSDVTLSQAGIATPDYDGFYLLMTDLFSLAGGQASGADKAVDDILNLLK